MKKKRNNGCTTNELIYYCFFDAGLIYNLVQETSGIEKTTPYVNLKNNTLLLCPWNNDDHANRDKGC